jgi:hypothetical protein
VRSQARLGETHDGQVERPNLGRAPTARPSCASPQKLQVPGSGWSMRGDPPGGTRK